jgi:hypothetical protein
MPTLKQAQSSLVLTLQEQTCECNVRSTGTCAAAKTNQAAFVTRKTSVAYQFRRCAQKCNARLQSCNCSKLGSMTDPNGIEALKASFRGALSTADALAVLEDKVMALDPASTLSAQDVDELGRVTLAHAVAAQALRAIVQSLISHR